MLLYFLIGRAIIWVTSWSEFWPLKKIWWLFGGCDLCMGVWVFTGLAFWLPLDLKVTLALPFSYLFVVTELVIGLLSSILVHLVRIGWEAKFDAVHA